MKKAATPDPKRASFPLLAKAWPGTITPRVSRGLRNLWIHLSLQRAPLLLWLVGMLLIFHPLFLSGFHTLVGDTGDSQLIACILEHHYLHLTNADYPGSYASGPFFFPATRNNMAFSELLTGAVPLYFVPRLVLGPEYGFQLFLMLVFSLDFFCFHWLLRRWAVPSWPSAVAAFVFAFGVFRGTHIPHLHLLLQYPSVLSFHFFLKFLLTPSTRCFTLAFAFACLQTLTSVYVGWFTILSFFVIFLYGVTLRGVNLKNLFAFARLRGLQVAGIAVLIASPCLWLLRPYFLLAIERGGRRYQEIEATLSSAGDWFYPFMGSFWWQVRRMLGDTLVQSSEGSLFLGVVPVGAALLSLPLVFRRMRLLPPATLLAGAVICSGFTLAALATTWPTTHQPWEFVYRYFPGASAIRAPGRIVVMVAMCLLFGSCVVLSRAFGSVPRRRIIGILVPLLVVGVVENSYRFVYSRSYFYFKPETAEIVRFLANPKITAAYIYPREREGRYISDINSMWVALQAHKPVVNGYSGADPANYDRNALKHPEQLLAWLADEPLASILVLVPEEALAALTPQLMSLGARPTGTGAHYTAFRLNAESRDFGADITLLDSPPKKLTTGETLKLQILLNNRSKFVWQSRGSNPVHLSYQLFRSDAESRPIYGRRTLLPSVLLPGRFSVIPLTFVAPLQPGQYRMVAAVVKEGVAWYVPRRLGGPQSFDITVVAQNEVLQRNGNGCIVRFRNWYSKESRGNIWWHWSAGESHIDITVARDTNVSLTGEFLTIEQPNTITLSVNNNDTAYTEISSGLRRKFEITRIRMRKGVNTIEFRSRNAGRRLPTDSRLLAFAIRNLSIRSEDDTACSLYW